MAVFVVVVEQCPESSVVDILQLTLCPSLLQILRNMGMLLYFFMISWCLDPLIPMERLGSLHE